MTQLTPIPRPVPVPAHVAITLSLADSSSDLLIRYVRLLRDCVALSQQRWEFGIDAAVVLPNTMHLLCEFSDSEFGVGGAVRLIKTAFARHLPNGTLGIWGDDADVLEIPTAAVPLRRTFMENAPVRAGLVKQAVDWPYSSAHRKDVLAGPMGAEVA